MSCVVKLGIGVWLLAFAFALVASTQATGLPVTERLGILGFLLAVPVVFYAIHRLAGGPANGGKVVAVAPPSAEPPPVAWIGEAAWASRNQAARFGSLGTHDARVADGVGTVSEDVTPTEIPEARREALPGAPIDGGRVRPPRGDRARDREALAKTPNVTAFWNPAPWPVCCGRLTRLVLVNPTTDELAVWEGRAGSLDGASFAREGTEAWAVALESIRRGRSWESGRADGDGVNLFQCSACGRVCGVHSHT